MVRIKEIRLKKYNYRADGYYFVTSVCDLRNNFFEGKETQVEAELKDLEQKTPGIKLDYYIVMPNHVHIIFVLQNSQLALGEVVRRFKAKVSHSLGQNVWQPNFYEHVIRNEKALKNIREYIINNPQELLLKFDQFYK
jgi:REP element-mobilizing transposase RayT